MATIKPKSIVRTPVGPVACVRVEVQAKVSLRFDWCSAPLCSITLYVYTHDLSEGTRTVHGNSNGPDRGTPPGPRRLRMFDRQIVSQL